jgi:hypothetical protein
MAYDPTVYDARRRNAQNAYGENEAMQLYSRFLSQNAFNRGKRDLTQSYNDATPKLFASFGRSGRNTANVKSGATGVGANRLAQSRIDALGQLQGNYDQQNYLADKQSFDSLGNYNNLLADIESDKARAQAEDAAIIMNRRAGLV